MSPFLRVCKMIYKEAVPVHYGTNTFCVSQRQLMLGSSAHRWLNPNISLVRRVFMNEHVEAGMYETWLEQLHENSGIQWDQLHSGAVRLGSLLGRSYDPNLWLFEVGDQEDQENQGNMGIFSDWPSCG
jgi:hypothetical protein